MKILFITTSNLATNPRLVKEISLALEMGYHPSVYYFEFRNWSKSLNDRILHSFDSRAKFYPISVSKKEVLPFLLSSLGEISARKTFHLFKWGTILPLGDKRSLLLLHNLRSQKGKYDLVIGHNPGALFPAFKFAQKNKIPFGFDMEDYHPGESQIPAIQHRTRQLMRKYLASASYISAASPLILEYTLNDLQDYGGEKTVINNSFPSQEFSVNPEAGKGKCKLVWFSQNIDKGRGLEQIVNLLPGYEGRIELHLYGHLRKGFYDQELAGIPGIIVHEPLPQQELHAELTKYDAGLAIEDKHSNLNRQICITNKIIAYCQSGLYVIASDTPAQQLLLTEYPQLGCLTETGREGLKKTLDNILAAIDVIRQERNSRYLTGNTFSWEKESKKLSKLWSKVATERRS